MQPYQGIKGIPFDATEILNPDGTYSYDNVYYSEDFAEWFRQYFSDGILVPGGEVLDTQLEVVKTGSAEVSIRPGALIIAGRNGIIYENYPMDLTLAATGYRRIDRIVIEMNEQENRFNLKAVNGEPSTGTPVKPELTRETITVGVDVYEIYQVSLAAVLVDSAGVVSIEDERSNFDVCGVSKVVPSVEKPELPTGDSALNIEYDSSETSVSIKTVQNALDLLLSREKILTLSAAKWGEDNTQTVEVEGITADSIIIADIIANTEKESNLWGSIWKAETLDGGVKFYNSGTAHLKDDLNVKLKVVG